MILSVTTDSAEATQAVAASLAGLIRSGDVVVLAGEMGAGKTAFTQGFGAALGVTEPITSPTFTLARQYEGRLVLHHLDVYRLDRFHELFDVGLPEMLDEGGVVVIEWGDAIAPALRTDFLEVHLSFGEGDDDRVLQLRSVGPAWHERWGRVGLALERFRGQG